MSGGYRFWSIWSSERVIRSPWSSWSSWTTRTFWCSSKGNVKHIADMLWVLVLSASGRVVSSRYKGARDDLCGRRQGLSRHSEATVHVSSDGRSLLVVSFSVWASRATWFDHCLCASDLYID